MDRPHTTNKTNKQLAPKLRGLSIKYIEWSMPAGRAWSVGEKVKLHLLNRIWEVKRSSLSHCRNAYTESRDSCLENTSGQRCQVFGEKVCRKIPPPPNKQNSPRNNQDFYWFICKKRITWTSEFDFFSPATRDKNKPKYICGIGSTASWLQFGKSFSRNRILVCFQTQENTLICIKLI